MNLRRIVPGVSIAGFSNNRKNWIVAVVILLAGIPVVRIASQVSGALTLPTVLFFIALSGLSTLSIGQVSGVVGLMREIRVKIRGSRPKELGAASSKDTVIELSSGGRVHSTYIGLGIEIVPVPVVDDEGNRRLLGVQHNKRRRSATIFLLTDGNSPLAFSTKQKRYVLDDRIAKAIESAQFEAGKGLVVRLISARRPTSALALAEELSRDLEPSIGRAWLNMRAEGRLEPGTSEELMATNFDQKFKHNVDGKPQYINIIALTQEMPSSWTDKPNKANPVKNSQVALLRASQVLEDRLPQLGFASVHPASLLEMHIQTRALLDIADLPGYLEGVEAELDSDSAATESASLEAGPFPTNIAIDDQTVRCSSNSFFIPYKKAVGPSQQVDPGGMDTFYQELPGWFTVCLRLEDLGRSSWRRRVEHETERTSIKALAKRRARNDPQVARDTDDLQRRIDEEFDAKGGIVRGDLYVMAGASISKRAISDGQRLKRLGMNRHDLALTHVSTQQNQLAAVLTTAGMDV